MLIKQHKNNNNLTKKNLPIIWKKLQANLHYMTHDTNSKQQKYECKYSLS